MKTKIFAFILGMFCLFSTAFSQSNTLTGFNGKIQFSGFADQGPNIRGTLAAFVDQTNQYFASDIDTNDIAWDNQGRRYVVVGVISSNLTQAVVDLSRIGGGSHIPTGVGFVNRETPNGLSLFPTTNSTGISAQLLGRVLTHNMEVMRGWGNGIISALPFGDVTIPTSNKLILKNSASLLFKNSAGKTGINMSGNYINTYKQTLGNEGAYIWIRDTTITPNFRYSINQSDYSFLQNGGVGPQIMETMWHDKIPGGIGWLAGYRLDTTYNPPVIRQMYGDRYHGINERLVALRFNSGLPNNATFPGFDFNFNGAAGKTSFLLTNNNKTVLFVRGSGKFAIGNDSTFVHDPVADSTFYKGKASFLQGSNYFQIKPFYNGIFSATTDGSGDITITIPTMPDATYTILALPQGNSTYQLSGHTATTTSFKLRCSLGAGQNITIFYEIKDY